MTKVRFQYNQQSNNVNITVISMKVYIADIYKEKHSVDFSV